MKLWKDFKQSIKQRMCKHVLNVYGRFVVDRNIQYNFSIQCPKCGYTIYPEDVFIDAIESDELKKKDLQLIVTKFVNALNNEKLDIYTKPKKCTGGA